MLKNPRCDCIAAAVFPETVVRCFGAVGADPTRVWQQAPKLHLGKVIQGQFDDEAHLQL